MRLTQDEILLIVAILTAIAVGAAVKEHRQRLRESGPAVAQEQEVAGKLR
ncbi:MAG: hypothetical protein M3463_09230 [Verrucomicrobiota bacterium]|nr:hypothetical protein [Verrucomicrobiota bacterium]